MDGPGRGFDTQSKFVTVYQGGITLKSLRRAAEAMDCDLVYAFVPRTTLESAVRMQAERVALQKLG